MEIKIIADKKLLDALNALSETLKTLKACPCAAAPQQPDSRADEQNPARETEPACKAPEAAQEMPSPEAQPPQSDVPTVDEVRRLAVTKIQAGLSAAVKELVTKYGATRVTDVAEDRRAAFKAELEAL